MKISHIEHLGIAVKSIEEALPYYENVLGLKCYNIETVEDQKVKTAFLKVGDTKIELLEPTSPESTIAKFIENKGAGVPCTDRMYGYCGRCRRNAAGQCYTGRRNDPWHCQLHHRGDSEARWEASASLSASAL